MNEQLSADPVGPGQTWQNRRTGRLVKVTDVFNVPLLVRYKYSSGATRELPPYLFFQRFRTEQECLECR